MKKQTTNTQFFYQNGKLVTVNQGNQQRAILRSANIPLAEQPTRRTTVLLATDDKGSVLSEQSVEEQEDHRFTAYGYDPGAHLGLSLLNFTGEWFQTATGCYLLGNGYRAYSPRLGRFHSPDSWSPFAQGGINAYCYCEGDPVNHSDPSGHVRVFLPNGQIMKIKGHTTVAAGRWLKPTSLKRTTSLESVVKGELPLQASHAAPRPATSGMQRPREIQVLDRAGEKQSDRVLHVWRSKGNRADLIHIQESQLAEFRSNQNALTYYRRSLSSYKSGTAPEILRNTVKSLEYKTEREIRFGKYLWEQAGARMNAIRR